MGTKGFLGLIAGLLLVFLGGWWVYTVETSLGRKVERADVVTEITTQTTDSNGIVNKVLAGLAGQFETNLKAFDGRLVAVEKKADTAMVAANTADAKAVAAQGMSARARTALTILAERYNGTSSIVGIDRSETQELADAATKAAEAAKSRAALKPSDRMVAAAAGLNANEFSASTPLKIKVEGNDVWINGKKVLSAAANGGGSSPPAAPAPQATAQN